MGFLHFVFSSTTVRVARERKSEHLLVNDRNYFKHQDFPEIPVPLYSVILCDRGMLRHTTNSFRRV